MKFPDLATRIRLSLIEDAAFHDLTTRLLPGINQKKHTAKVIAHESGVFCGSTIIGMVFKLLDSGVQMKLKAKDGQHIRPGQCLAEITARPDALLAGERTMLNLINHLSGIATLTSRYVRAIKGTETSIVDTRKTTPLWRDLEKWAVVCGGGVNHRFSLEDAILVKDNHLTYVKDSGLSVTQLYGNSKLLKKRFKNLKFICMEAKTIPEVWNAIKARCDIILLDNMSMDLLKRSHVLIHSARRALSSSRPMVEVSGGVTLTNIRAIAGLGVDRISVGSLTHSAPALDISLEF